MEPRNIGVIVWTPGATAARFLAEKAGASVQVDGRSIPPFVTSTVAYKEWVRFWRHELGRRHVVPTRQAKDWLEELKGTSRGNFLLADGGVLLDPIELDQLPKVTEDLFYRLVESNASDEARDTLLDQVADNVIRELRLRENRNFHTRYEVPCQVAPNVQERFEFSHAYANGRLERLYQRVPLGRKRALLRRTVHDSAWMFEKVVQKGIIKREQAIALVFATKEHKTDPEVSWSLDVLRSVARVANLADQAEAVSAFLM
jgi:hypothetical protein